LPPRRALQAREREQMARRQVLTGQLLMSKAVKRAQGMSDEEVAHLSVWEMVRMLEAGVRLERLGLGEPANLDVAVPQNLVVTSPETPIMEILRRNPNRVGVVVPLLVKLEEALADFLDADTDDGVEDEELADLLRKPAGAEGS